MAGWWRALPRAARRYPWPTNVLLYAGLYSAGDALQQRLRGGPADWRQTRCVATVAVTFHANFNYVWLRLLERALPGRAPGAVLAKVLCDQALGGPVALSAFYVGTPHETKNLVACCSLSQPHGRWDQCSQRIDNLRAGTSWFIRRSVPGPRA
uniref:MPV17 mitochondrial inner membrane protein like n=1 Tax=Microcebus murinus TaxID=30608 RepID=A0A8C5Y5Y1_MICMU